MLNIITYIYVTLLVVFPTGESWFNSMFTKKKEKKKKRGMMKEEIIH